MHRCCGAGHYDPCTHRCYGAGLLFIYFQLWNGLQYAIPEVWQVVFPNVSANTLMYIVSFTALAMLWSSLPIILKFSTDVMWPVLLWCSCIGDGAFRCSLYLSSKVVADSPIYSSSQSILSHLNQYITLLFFLMLSVSLHDTSKFLMGFLPLKYT